MNSIKKTVTTILVLSLISAVALGQLIDKKPTVATRKLYRNLTSLYGKAVLIGHQDDMAYGVGWKYEEGRSDIKDLTGQYPAVFGWDVAGLETNKLKNIDGIPFSKMREYIKKAYSMGAINTLSWHMDNPMNGRNSWDTTSAVTSILPGGKKHQLYLSWLNKFSVFVKSLKGRNNEPIPILFRPFHENGGGWFWWGAKSCTPGQYKKLWQFTVGYLKDKKQLHNLIYVYNPCDFINETQYLERYPGRNFADVLSFDHYQIGIENGDKFAKEVARNLAIQHTIALREKKISAIAEAGFVEIPQANWWTKVLMNAIEVHPPSYILFWRNAGYRESEKDNHYYAPYPGQTSSADFLKFIENDKIVLHKRLKSVYK